MNQFESPPPATTACPDEKDHHTGSRHRRSPEAVEEYCRFYRQEFTALCRFLYRRGADFDDVRDIAQEAMQDLWLQWDAIYAPRSWIRVVASRKWCATRSTAWRVTTSLPEIASGDHIDERACAAFGLSDEEAHVLHVLRTLPSRQAQVLAWTLDGYTPAEIAARISSTAGAVRKALFDARSTLKLRNLRSGGLQ
ncbi:RNA polymerase sigma factor [Streptodolium elevatio]|uniref:RNA polymerase sigma factor n=1 Tax=Streptodolium elevatio TaxID=3157996 RepID=A0ABV3DR17_9ACTN